MHATCELDSTAGAALRSIPIRSIGPSDVAKFVDRVNGPRVESSAEAGYQV